MRRDYKQLHKQRAKNDENVKPQPSYDELWLNSISLGKNVLLKTEIWKTIKSL